MKNFVFFIDEFPNDFQLILFLRNIARAIRLPVVLAATNAKIANMVGTSAAFGSRRDSAQPWVKLITKLPGADPLIMAKFCEFKCNERILTLDSFLSDGSDFDVDVDSLMKFLVINCNENEIRGIKILFKLLFNQAKTCLPGIILVIFQNLNKILIDSATAIAAAITTAEIGGSINIVFHVWKNICNLIYKEVRVRKVSMVNIKSFFSSGYIISAHEETNLMPEMNEAFHAASIDSHFFRLGTRNTPEILEFSLSGINLYQNSHKWKCHSYFSRFDEDIFVHFAAWGPAFYENLNSCGICCSSKFSLARVIEDAVRTDYFSNSNALKNNYKAQETLALWAISNASHSNVFGRTGGIQFLLEFAGHLQSVSESDQLYPRDLLSLTDIPSKLIGFLELLSIPYCIENSLNEMDSNFVSLISNFMEIGHLYRCSDKDSIDINFPIRFNGIAYKASVECKYQDAPTNIALVSKYTQKSVLNQIPLSIFVTNHVASNFLIPNYFSNLSQEDCEALGISKFNSDSIFKLNHYLVTLANNAIPKKLIVNTLFEHDFAQGCVIIITTNLFIPKI